MLPEDDPPSLLYFEREDAQRPKGVVNMSQAVAVRCCVAAPSRGMRRYHIINHDNKVIDGGFTQYYDKVALKFDSENIVQSGARIVPPAVVRKGAFIGSNTILMPSYVNIGAYIDSGTMVDTWATV